MIARLTALLLMLVACGGGGFDPTGSWSVTGSGEEAIVIYKADSTYAIAAVEGQVVLPFDSGSWTVTGDMISFISSASSVGCESGDIGTYQVVETDPSRWSLQLLEDDCEVRSEGQPFVHVAQPKSPGD